MKIHQFLVSLVFVFSATILRAEFVDKEIEDGGGISRVASPMTAPNLASEVSDVRMVTPQQRNAHQPKNWISPSTRLATEILGFSLNTASIFFPAVIPVATGVNIITCVQSAVSPDRDNGLSVSKFAFIICTVSADSPAYIFPIASAISNFFGGMIASKDVPPVESWGLF